jgi:hypothetical protein
MSAKKTARRKPARTLEARALRQVHKPESRAISKGQRGFERHLLAVLRKCRQEDQLAVFAYAERLALNRMMVRIAKKAEARP